MYGDESTGTHETNQQQFCGGLHIRLHRMTITSSLRSHRSFSTWLNGHGTVVNLVSFGLLVVLCVSYIIQVNQSVSKGYQIRDLETEIHALTIANPKMELETQRAQALTNVAHATKMLGLVKADQPTYLSTTVPSFALAK